jgi:small GTP-binding protein
MITKVVIIGNSGVGKTCIANVIANDEFSDQYQATIGANYSVKELNYGGKDYKLQLWDTAGQERYQGMTPMYFHSAKVAIVVFSLDDEDSFEGVDKWMDIVNDFHEKIGIILTGNKADLESSRVISSAEAIAKAEKFKCPYVEISAKTRLCIEELINMIPEVIIQDEDENSKPNAESVDIGSTEVKKNKDSTCCK